MKRIASVFFSLLLVLTLSVGASATENTDSNILLSRSVEILDNGDYIVTETYETATQPRASIKTGYRTSTYNNSDGTKIWDVTVQGTFSYSYGISSTATDAIAIVNIYNSNAEYRSKSAYTSGNTAYASATIVYKQYVTSRTVSISCDEYGNLY